MLNEDEMRDAVLLVFANKQVLMTLMVLEIYEVRYRYHSNAFDNISHRLSKQTC